ncbi:hypothetical protein [Marinicrinis sediminis]|uniref:AraC-type arabinose-binding/dimerisation domain-containing protein n=1 Tax=Marinicrinis sediminis TaxID=1652465 RepID=A0ABW5RDH2_9BACL
MIPIAEMMEWSRQYSGKTVQISKYESEDLDHLILHLDKVTFTALDPHDEDSYLASHALYLHGYGMFDTHQSYVQTYLPHAPLPGQIYVIPLDEVHRCEIMPDHLYIQTARANYSIKPLRNMPDLH